MRQLPVYIASFLLLITHSSISQIWVDVDDPALQDFMCENYNAYMNDSCTQMDRQLVNHWNEEINLNGIFDIEGLGIADFDIVNWFTKIDTIYGANNNISDLPTIELNSCDLIDFGNNHLTEFEIDSMPNTNNYQPSHTILLNDNQLGLFPSVLHTAPALQVLDVRNNNIDSLPSLSEYNQFTDVDLTLNYLTFEDIIPISTLGTYTSMKVFPQKDIPAPDTIIIDFGGTLVIDLDMDTDVTNNTYHWYRNGVEIATETTPVLTLTSALPGLYFAEVENGDPGLENELLTTETIVVLSIPDIDALIGAYEVVTSCEGASVELDLPVFNTFGNDFDFFLLDSISGVPVQIEDHVFSEIPQGEFDLLVYFQGSYALTLENWVVISSLSDCDVVISPNGDGIQDTFFFNFTGETEIFNKSGILVKTLTLPGSWDATDNLGQLVDPGVYILHSEGEEFATVTVIR